MNKKLWEIGIMRGGLAPRYQNVLQIYSNQNNMALMLSSNSDFFFLSFFPYCNPDLLKSILFYETSLDYPTWKSFPITRLPFFLVTDIIFLAI